MLGGHDGGELRRVAGVEELEELIKQDKIVDYTSLDAWKIK